MDPSDPKYAPEAQQARQNVMVGVSTFMTILGGMSYDLSVAQPITDQRCCSDFCRASNLYTGLHRPQSVY